MKASVIIPTRDRAVILERCLESLSRQTASPDHFEVIVVDNGSTDHTSRVVEKFTSKFHVRYILELEPGLHAGRHAGMRVAKSDLLMYADDDIVAEPSWVDAVLAAFQDSSVALVGGNNYPSFQGKPPAWLDRLWARRVPLGRALGPLSILDFGHGRFAVDPAFVWGCNFSIRRNVLLACRGFHPDALPKARIMQRGDGESHVARFVRTGPWRAVFDSRASVHHLVSARRMTPEYFEERYYAQGISDSFVAVRTAGGVATGSVLARNAVRKLWWRVRRGIGMDRLGRDEAANMARQVLRRAESGYWRGYADHQRRVQAEPALLAWVLRESYF